MGSVLGRVWPRIRERYVRYGAGRLPTEGDQRNVITMTDVSRGVKELEGRDWPCPVCGEGRDIRLSKKAKPYYVCSDCGVQVFVREAPGIGRMIEGLENGEVSDEDDGEDRGSWLFDMLTGRREP